MIAQERPSPVPDYDAALAAYDAGIATIPVATDGSKSAGVPWKRYQTQRPDPELLRSWYIDQGLQGVAYICGAVSGHLQMVEFETWDLWEAFKDAARAAGLADLVERIEAGYLSGSPGGGVHVLFRCKETGTNTKLARRPKRPEEKRHPNDDVQVLVETREEGGLTIEPPSAGSVHPTGRPYRQIRGNVASIATIAPEERRELFALARSFDDMPKAAPQEPRVASPAGTGRPGDDFNERVDWSDLLSDHGWVQVYMRGGTTYWRRPGKDRGVSATTNHAGSALLYVFTSSTGFESERSYTKFGAYATLEHGGDFRAATRALRERGYGAPPPPPFRVIDGGQVGSDGAGGTGSAPPQGGAQDLSTPLHLTDMGNAERLQRRHGKDLHYCKVWGSWLLWDGQRWAKDDAGHVVRLAKDTVRAIYVEASAAGDDETRKAIAKHALKSEQEARIRAAIGLAESEPGIPATPDQFDQHRWLLNCRNGTLDLRTGELRTHERDDLLTRLAPVAFDPDAGCPTLLAFLGRIMAGNEGLIQFLQRAIGYSLTGDTTERVLMILHGEGRNGKSTLLEVVRGILGDYAVRTPTETLLAKRDNTIPNDIAKLKGARFVSASESDEGRRLDEAKIKDLTGGDTVSARFMRGEWFDFLPEFKLWLGTNHKPVIRGTDRAIWDRIRLVPFAVRIPDEEQDKQLRVKLLAEAPGILAWAVRGCLDWQRDGLGEPQEVKNATAGYRAEMDVLGAFLEDCCIVAPDIQCPAKGLYAAYQAWCEETGEKTLTQKAVGQRLSERGFDAARVGKNRTRYWVGLGLKSSDQADAFDRRTHADAKSDITGSVFEPRGDMPKNASERVRQENASASEGYDSSPLWDDMPPLDDQEDDDPWTR